MNLRIILSKWSRTSLVLRIFIGLTIGACLGLIVPEWTGISILGAVFVSALKAIAPVLVAVLVAASIAKAGGGLGPRFRVVVSRYMLSTFIAAMCAVVGSFLFPVTLQLSDVAEQAAPGALTDVFSNLLTNMVTNPIMSVSQANYIGILFWAILIGLALKLKASQNTIDVVQDFSDVITLTVKWVIQFAPFGILGLVFKSVSEGGLDVFTTYGHLILLLVGCMLANTLIFNPLISFLMLRRNPYPLLFTCL
ncbi:MAG: cation:dicarboxylase symporter family transporter, partial [Prevotella sp.]|nr:cation:dicarboxylase symporter family transporter [Prevotella sp.]